MGGERIDATVAALRALDTERLQRWGDHIATVLSQGGRLLTAGNGGSAAHAEHLAAELVGRYQTGRPPLSAIALPTASASLTALGNDYGFEQVFARGVEAHGRAGDVLLCISTSGRSANVLAAAAVARERSLITLALTGSAPNLLTAAVDDAVATDADNHAVVQEVHQVALHLLCEALEASLS